jgi:NADH-quinone oxidoreductase subunit C
MATVDATPLVSLLHEAFPDAGLEAAPSLDVQETVYVAREHAPALFAALHDRADLRFTVLVELTAADYWPREPRFELVYMLLSPEHRYRLRVKIRIAADAARVPTVSAIWSGANWLEREVWDLFGIEFEGHPDPRRLLMPEDWEGYPLRKDYPVQITMTPRTTEPTQVTEEEFRANIAKDRLVRQP